MTGRKRIQHGMALRRGGAVRWAGLPLTEILHHAAERPLLNPAVSVRDTASELFKLINCGRRWGEISMASWSPIQSHPSRSYIFPRQHRAPVGTRRAMPPCAATVAIASEKPSVQSVFIPPSKRKCGLNQHPGADNAHIKRDRNGV